MKRARVIAVIAPLILIWGIGQAFGQEQRDELYEELSASLARAEALVAATVLNDDASLTAEQLEGLSTLNRQIRGSLYSDLIDRSDLLLLLTREQMLLQQDPQSLEARLNTVLRESQLDARTRERSAARDRVLRASFGTTIVSFALAFTFWGLAEWQDRRYFESTTSEGAKLHRRLFQLFSIGSVATAAVGVAGAGLTVTLYER